MQSHRNPDDVRWQAEQWQLLQAERILAICRDLGYDPQKLTPEQVDQVEGILDELEARLRGEPR